MIQLPPLPWGESALAPHISQETISFHYGRHHKAYVDNANKMIEGTELANASLEEIVRSAAGKPDKKGLFNNSAQVWNHTFYWHSLSPKGGGQPTGKLLDRIKSDFGDFAAFKEALSKAAVTQFGSGWAWLVLEGGKLKVEQTPNAETPITVRRQDAAADDRRLGARVLRRLPQQASGLRDGRDRQAPRLGVRGEEPRLAAVARRPAGGDHFPQAAARAHSGARARTRRPARRSRLRRPRPAAGPPSVWRADRCPTGLSRPALKSLKTKTTALARRLHSLDRALA